MSLPNKIQHQAITGASLPSTIDNDINAFKLGVLDIFGIPDNANISAAVMSVAATGLTAVVFRDAAGNPATAGHLQRNGTLLNFYDGSANRVLVSRDLAETLTNKTLTAPVLGGSITGTYTLAGTPTLTSPQVNTPTIASPVLSGTATGTYTLGGTPTLTAPIINTGTVGAAPTVDLGIANKLYVDERNLNPIINGSMEVWQRGTTFAAASGYTADRWSLLSSMASVVTINRSTNVPSVAQAGVLFNYSYEVDVTTADASLAAADRTYINQRIEGFNWRTFAQRDLVISFWVSSTVTGTYAVAIRNSGADRSYIGTYSIDAADTWEYKSVLISASPSAGTWDYTTGIGANVAFALAMGANYHTTAGAWQTGDFFSTATQANAMSSTSNFFRLTGVKLELGSVATPIQFVPFETERARSQRYYQKSFRYDTAPAQNVGANTGYTIAQSTVAGAATALLPVYLPVQLRSSTISVTLYNPLATNGQIRNFTDSADFTGSTATVNSESSFVISGTGSAGLAAGEQFGVHWTADAEL